MENKTKYIQELSEYIYENVSKISYGITNINSIYRFYTSFAMSKAEYSTLTVKEAIEIQKKEIDKINDHYFNDIKDEINQLSIYEKNYQKQLQALHDKLEYYNIANTIKYISESNIAEIIKKNGLDDGVLLDLHYRLTIGLDELFYWKLNGYDPYFSWKFRTKNNIKVWTKLVLDHNLIKEHLDNIKWLSKNISSLSDIFYLHARLYYCHAFSNGNKRICRVLEEIYIVNLWIEPSLSASHWYYLQQDRYISQIYLKTIRKPLFHTFEDLGYSSLILSALYILHNELSSIKKKILKDYDITILKGFHEWERFKTKDLEITYTKKLKIWERAFFKILDKEKELLWNIITENKVWRNVYYSLDIQDEKYKEIKSKIQELLGIYSEYNYNYNEIGFLKNYKF